MVSAFFLTKSIIINCYKFDISQSAKLVFIYLSTCYNKKNKYVFPKQSTIARAIGISRGSVIKSIKELESINLITKKRGYTNLYEINLSEFFTSNVKKTNIECSDSVPPYITDKEKIKKHSFSHNIDKTQELLKSYSDMKLEEDYTCWNKERAIEHLRKGIPRSMFNISTVAKYLIEKFSINPLMI